MFSFLNGSRQKRDKNETTSERKAAEVVPQPAATKAEAHSAEVEQPFLGLGGIFDKVRDLKKAGQAQAAGELLMATFREREHPVVAYRMIATLLDLRRYDTILEFPSAKPFNSRDFSLAEYLVSAGPDRAASPLMSDSPAWQGLGYVTMVKDEQDILLFNLVWHYAMGVRRFFVIDNLSTDRTPALLQLFQQAFADVTVLTLKDTVMAHFQGRKVSGACWYLKSLWPELEWLILVDADEFVCSDRPLREMLEAVPAEIDAVALPKSIYALTPGDAVEDVDHFFYRLTHRQPLSHVSAKVIVRARVGMEIAQGNHKLLEAGHYARASYTSLPGLTMREFPMRTRAQFERKVISGAQAVKAAREQGLVAVGGDHWMNLYRLLEQGGSQALQARLDTQIANNAERACIADPLAMGTVMDRHLPDWRQAVPLTVTAVPRTGS
ncbi:glycosyltransferase family 2 protein [Ideonella azotifigens]|uniref:Glycosyltransferase family 2 protein n=1 Tax=Ideonella azotifigens TaxID=513160 RepID=A0ABN1JPA5_9BURK|nr:glycosyltransferase family 2 protein [Ideonella azotifigens]MCD2340047.1 glycosyltransferase family 2 protein [Ideonella azotifigens]